MCIRDRTRGLLSRWSMHPRRRKNAPKSHWESSVVFVGVDVTNSEAVAAGRIVGMLVSQQCDDHLHLMPQMLIDVPCENDGHFAIPQHAK
eukprot:5520451-Amphidinium_carterae.1